jgi:methionyl-tRNA formyltransferase
VQPLVTLFFGTAQLACPALLTLAKSSACHVATVVSQPDRPAGRKLQPRPSPVKKLALQLGFPLLQPQRARSPEFINTIRLLKPDLAIIAAYGQIIPESLLAIPSLGFLNVHASLLPAYRGAAPIQWAILNDDTQTGVTIMKLNQGLDTGDILTQISTPILNTDNAQSLHDRLASLGASLLLHTLPPYVSGCLLPSPQPTIGVSYAPKITRQLGRLDWNLTARQLWNRTRALIPWPGTFTFLPAPSKPDLLKVITASIVPRPHASPGEILAASRDNLVVACATDALRLDQVQPEGKRPMSAAEFLAGHRLVPGQRLA